MKNVSSELLSRLASGVRPDGIRPTQPVAPLDQRSFDALLKDASSGVISSGLPVEIPATLDVTLSEKQSEGLATAVDAAAAAGAQRLLVYLGDEALTVDVPSRTATRHIEDVREAGPIVDVDAAIVLDSQGSSGATSDAEEPSALGALIRNPSLQTLLAALDDAGVIGDEK
ncbi:MAG: hypothetical protein RIB58_04620 [Phycisphaerales bacterium]